MTMVLRRVGRYRLATWTRTQPWPQPSGQEQGGVGGRLLGGRVLCECGAWCCAATRDGSRLV